MWPEMTPNNLYDQVHAELLKGEISNAEKIVKAFKPLDTIERRIVGHAQGKIYLFKHEYQKAISALETTLAAEGPYLGLLLDLANGFYLQNSFGQLRVLIESITSELPMLKNRMCEIKYFRSRLLLAKFQEDMGAVAEAKKFYAEEFTKNHNPDIKVHLLSQLLRWESEFGPSQQISHYYSVVKQMTTAQLGFEGEFFHAQIMAEVALFGPTIAIENFFNGIEKLKSEYELSFIGADLCESLLCRDFKVPNRLNEFMEKCQPTTAYETIMRNLIVYDQLPNAESLFKMMPLGEALRLACLVERKSNRSTSSPLFDQLKIMIDGLGRANSALWRRKFWNSSQLKDGKIAYWSKNRCIHIAEREIDFSSRTALWNFMQIFRVKKAWSFEEITLKLWNLELSESSYQRVRRNVERINSLAYSQIFENPLKISENHVHFTYAIGDDEESGLN